MKKTILHFAERILPFIFAWVTLPASADSYSFRLKNPSGFKRHELVEIQMPQSIELNRSSLKDEKGTPVPYESCGNNHIRFLAEIDVCSTLGYTLSEGNPTQPRKLAFVAQMLPESRNDIAWENNYSAYRMYSHKLQSSEPETANGVDLWGKKTDAPIIESMYSLSNYHSESQFGVDAYSVNGKTLGAGGVAAYADGKLWLHDAYDECEIIEDGRLKSEFLLTYNHVEVNGRSYKKTLRITTSANGLLNKAVVKYEGAPQVMKLAVGIFTHQNMTGVTSEGKRFTSIPGVIGYAENPSEGTVTSPNARFYEGAYIPGTTDPAFEMDGHLVQTIDYTPGDEVTFYFGGGWNIFPENLWPTDEDWFEALEEFKQSIENPIVETSITQLPRKDDVADIIHKVNQYWMTTNPTHGNYFWNRAVYHIGNMEAYRTTGEPTYLDFSTAWAEHNNWSGPTGDDPSKWTYTYGENNVLFGDCQACFQVYSELYGLTPDEKRIARAKQVFEYQMGTAANDYLYWVDGLFMVMPAMSHLYRITQDGKYLEKMHDYWSYANSIMYDEETGLYYRDAKYVYPAHQTNSGKKDFWARGDGWIFAAFARVLADLPENHPHRNEYLSYYQKMARTLALCQEKEGYWTRSLLDPAFAPGYETSGTSLILYGFLWGINSGNLNEKEYGLTIEKAWNYLSKTALQANGRVGYVQPIGEKADPDQTVSENSTGDFGVGAYLMAACEMYRYATDNPSPRPLRLANAHITSPIQIILTFNEEVDVQTGASTQHYTINGKPAEASVKVKGKEVILSFTTPIPYGHPELKVSGLRGTNGGVMEEDATRILVLPVPLYPNQYIVSVSASGSQTGNPHTQAVDNDLSTLWSQYVIVEWICFELGSQINVSGIDLAYYQGNTRYNFFDIQASTDGITFQNVMEDVQTSGQTNELERYTFTPVKARYIRIWCKGNSAGGDQWNSITEARVISEEAPTQTFYEGDEITPEGAWCWFADPRALHYENADGSINATYVGYIDVHGNIKAMQYDFIRNERKEILIRSCFQPDDHDNPTFLVLPDERIMVFYSRHTDEPCFYYRVSQKKGDLATLGEEKTIATEANTTYPSPFFLSEDPEHFYLCWRGINWHPTIARLSLPDKNDNVKTDWGPYQIVQSTGARPYAKYHSNGKDRIMLAYTTGHPDNEYPNFVYFNTINIHTLQLEDAAGNVLSTIQDGPFHVDKTKQYIEKYSSTLVDYPTDKRDWLWQISETENGMPAILLTQISNDKSSHDYYHAEWNGTKWAKTLLANGGGKFHQTPNLELCYSAGMTMNPENPHEIYASLPIDGMNGRKYEIVKMEISKDGSISKEQVTSNSGYNNVRPYFIPGSEKSPLQLAWMHGNYYDWIVSASQPEGYATAIHCDFKWEYAKTDLSDGLVTYETFDEVADGNTYNGQSTAIVKSGVLLTHKGEYANIPMPTRDFTLSLSLQISQYQYYGDIVAFGNLRYGLDSLTMKPYLRIGTERFDSPNKLATSDVWREQGRSTNGVWYTPSKLGFFNLTLTYSDGIITSFINGLLDQQVETNIIPTEEMLVGGFEGWVEDYHYYSRALNSDEIKLLSANSRQYTLSDEAQAEEALNQLTVSQKVHTDIPLATQTKEGQSIQWTSSNEELLSSTGIVTLPSEPTEVALTARIGNLNKEFILTVYPRDILENLILHYTFAPQDVYEENGTKFLKDQSGRLHDAEIKGSAVINGTLDLTRNTPKGFSSNGYLIVPSNILGNMRSYTFFLRAIPKNLSSQPRFYDFGSDSGNSIFGRANKLSAGVKYNNGTTAMVNANKQLQTETEACVAFTYDAGTRTTRIYWNDEIVGNGTNIIREPYEVATVASDLRNYIGRTQWWDSSVAADNADFCGQIDDFYIFDIALNPDEIAKLYEKVTSVESISTEGQDVKAWRLSQNVCEPGAALNIYSTNTSKIHLEIFNSNGQLIRHIPNLTSGSYFNAPMEKGMYFVHITPSPDKKQTEKLIIK